MSRREVSLEAAAVAASSSTPKRREARQPPLEHRQMDFCEDYASAMGPA